VHTITAIIFQLRRRLRSTAKAKKLKVKTVHRILETLTVT